MLVSVVVPSLGGVRTLPRVLASLAAQRDVVWEAIVVLDGVVDESPAVVEYWSRFADVRAIEFSENRGRPAALNAGFAAARGDVLVRCDDDLLLPPDFLACHAAHHVGDPVGVVGMCADVFDNTPYAASYGRRNDEAIRANAYALPPASTWRLWSANVSVTRETFDRVGPYDEDYRAYGWEDVDWGYRLHRAGVPVIVPSDVEAEHLSPARSTRERASKAYDSGASRRLFNSKHPEAADMMGQRPNRSLWNAGVGLTSRVPRRVLVGPLARGVDAVIGHVPRPVATKLVSAVVEAAGLAGNRRH